METICMECLILFLGKVRKNIMNLSSAELAQRVVNLKYYLDKANPTEADAEAFIAIEGSIKHWLDNDNPSLMTQGNYNEVPLLLC